MNVPTSSEKIAAIIDTANKAQVLSDNQISAIEDQIGSLGGGSGDFAEALKQFRRALAHHRLRNVGADPDSIRLAFAHVHESWQSVASGLRESAGAMEVA